MISSKSSGSVDSAGQVYSTLLSILPVSVTHRNCFICRTNYDWDPVRAQFVTVTSMHQATIFLKGHILSWLTDLLWSTFTSLHSSTWLSVAVPRWTCLFPLLLQVTHTFPEKVPTIKNNEREKWLVGGGTWRRDLSLPQIHIATGRDPSRSTRNVTKALANRVGSMKNYWTWNYHWYWTTTCLAGWCHGWQWHIWNQINAYKFTCNE